jgi:hypothetical protein
MMETIDMTGNTFPPISRKTVPSCTIEGCKRPHKARGLCVTHYRRLQRNGNPDGVRKGGRPEDVYLQIVRMILPDWSPRTQARYVRAWKMADAAGRDIKELIQKVTRRNGSINVRELEEWAETALVLRLVEAERECRP